MVVNQLYCNKNVLKYLRVIIPSSLSFTPSAAVAAKLLQSCLTLCDPMDYSPPVSSVHGILQARLLEWVPMPSSRGSS